MQNSSRPNQMLVVTGANGLLGSFIIRKLIQEGIAVRAFRRATSNTSHLRDINEQVDWRTVALDDMQDLRENLHGADGVIHAAGLVSFDPRKRKDLLITNYEGTRNIVNACLSLGVPRLLYVSSVAALNPAAETAHVNEGILHTTGKKFSAYGESKYLAELEVFRGQEEGLHTIIVNPSVVLSPEHWDRSSGRIFWYLSQQFPFYIRGLMNYVDVRDVAELTYRLYRSDIENERMIISAGAVDFGDFLAQAALRLGKRPPGIRVTKRMLKFAVYAEAIRAWLMQREPVVTSESTALAGNLTCYDNTKVRRILDFEFRPFEQTLEWCCARGQQPGIFKN